MSLVDHPKHYNNHPSGVEAIEIVQYMGFCLGNAFKYVYRYQHKNGLQDIEKAIWYLKRQQTIIINKKLVATHTATNDFYKILSAEPNADIKKVLQIIWDVSFHNQKNGMLGIAINILIDMLENNEI